MQKAIPVIDHIFGMSRILSRDERITLIKMLAADLGEPLYTTADVQSAIRQKQAQDEEVRRNRAAFERVARLR